MGILFPHTLYPENSFLKESHFKEILKGQGKIMLKNGKKEKKFLRQQGNWWRFKIMLPLSNLRAVHVTFLTESNKYTDQFKSWKFLQGNCVYF